MECAVELLTLAVPLRVVWSCAALLYPVHLTQLLDKEALKVSPPVGVYTGWRTKSMEPLLHQGLGHCGSFLILSRDSLQILCEDVCKNQDILSSIAGRLQLSEVKGQNFIWSSGLH